MTALLSVFSGSPVVVMLLPEIDPLRFRRTHDRHLAKVQVCP